MAKNKENVEKDDKSGIRDSVLAKLNKSHGLGTIGVYTDMPMLDVEVISTGSMNLDIATGIGGLPRGRIVEIYGPEASGKTTLALSAVAQAQKAGGLAAYVDIEHALDPTYMEAIGVDLGSLVLSQPSHGEMAIDIIDELATSGVFDIVVLDSVAAMVPKAELEGDITDYHVGTQARLMSKACRVLGGTLSKTKTSMVFINQIRQKIGVMFGSNETTTGGLALKFWSSLRIESRRKGSVKDGDNDATGNDTICKIVKNKMAPPFRSAVFEITFGKGINKTKEIVDLATDMNLVDKSGSWYKIDGKNVAQGVEQLCEYLNQNPDLAAAFEKQIREKHNLK
jgi:recombination protein RecA